MIERCKHNWEEIGNKNICKLCKKEFLKLDKINDNILLGTKSNGVKYTVRGNRKRYFFPNEWTEFINTITNEKHRLFFQLLLFTGGRAMEVINLRCNDFDLDRGTVNFRITKKRKAKRNFYATSGPRSFFISSNCINELKRYNRRNNIKQNDYYFLYREKLPENYDNLSNLEMKKYYIGTETAYFSLFKRKMKETSIKDPECFSLHNIRKTYGMYMKTFEIEISELCYRLGHDLDTYLAHYGSSLIFNEQDRIGIQKIFGETK